MSSCCVSVCLLVLLGAVMAFGNPLRGDHAVSQSISRLLQLDDQEIGSKPLFSSALDNINTSCQRKEDIVLLTTTLDVYMRIFSSILQHSHDHHHGEAATSTLLGHLSTDDKKQVKSLVKDLQEKMKTLKGQLGSFEDNTEDLISKLNNIKVDDPKNQRRALAEFGSVFRAASLISTQS